MKAWRRLSEGLPARGRWESSSYFRFWSVLIPFSKCASPQAVLEKPSAVSSDAATKVEKKSVTAVRFSLLLVVSNELREQQTSLVEFSSACSLQQKTWVCVNQRSTTRHRSVGHLEQGGTEPKQSLHHFWFWMFYFETVMSPFSTPVFILDSSLSSCSPRSRVLNAFITFLKQLLWLPN